MCIQGAKCISVIHTDVLSWVLPGRHFANRKLHNVHWHSQTVKWVNPYIHCCL